MARAHIIDPETCRAAARERFTLAPMIAAYFGVYQHLTRSAVLPSAGAA